jgi:methylated-DNA-[protein]-cysteine S-methyltransferase
VSNQNGVSVTHFASPIGDILLSSDAEAITGLWMEGQRYFAQSLPTAWEERLTPVLEEAVRWLKIYFQGAAPDYFPPLRPEGTRFQLTVWEILCTIPFGRTVTYGELADLVAAKLNRTAMSARAVGGAVSRNPISIMIPCHRVIGANRALTGYAGGLERKRFLLEIEKTSHDRSDSC